MWPATHDSQGFLVLFFQKHSLLFEKFAQTLKITCKLLYFLPSCYGFFFFISGKICSSNCLNLYAGYMLHALLLCFLFVSLFLLEVHFSFQLGKCGTIAILNGKGIVKLILVGWAVVPYCSSFPPALLNSTKIIWGFAFPLVCLSLSSLPLIGSH